MDVLAIIAELEAHGITKERAFGIAATLINIGARAAPWQRDVVSAVVDIEMRRVQANRMTRQ